MLDTVNTIKEETSFICSASPTHRHTRRKRDSRTHAKHRQKKTGCQCKNEAPANRQGNAQLYALAHTTGQKCNSPRPSAFLKNETVPLGTNAGGQAGYADLLWNSPRNFAFQIRINVGVRMAKSISGSRVKTTTMTR